MTTEFGFESVDTLKVRDAKDVEEVVRAAIAGELCALPTTAVGALVAKVPWPFGFETVPLDDGPCLGFICGPAGVAGAANITPYGGWRAWLSAARS